MESKDNGNFGKEKGRKEKRRLQRRHPIHPPSAVSATPTSHQQYKTKQLITESIFASVHTPYFKVTTRRSRYLRALLHTPTYEVKHRIIVPSTRVTLLCSFSLLRIRCYICTQEYIQYYCQFTENHVQASRCSYIEVYTIYDQWHHPDS